MKIDQHDISKLESLPCPRFELMADKLSPHIMQMFGYHALFYGPLGKALCRQELSIKHQIVIGQTGKELSLKCKYEELPIASDTIDLALLPLTLQESQNPHQILREVERVLIPEGNVVVIGRNPFGRDGLTHTFKNWKNKDQNPLKDISRRRIIDWFGLLGFDIESKINLSVTNDKLQNSKSYPWVKKLGQKFCDLFCGYYIIIGKKKVSTLTPIRPSWRKNKQLVPSRLAEPSVRGKVESWFEELK